MLLKLKETFFVKEARSCTDWVERDFFNTGGVKGRTEFEYICSICGAPPEDSPLVADAVLGLRDGRKLLPCCEDCHAAKKKPLAYGKGLTSPWRRRRSARARWRSGRRAQPNGADAGAGAGAGAGAASCLTLRTRTRRWVVLTHHPRTPLPRLAAAAGATRTATKTTGQTAARRRLSTIRTE